MLPKKESVPRRCSCNKVWLCELGFIRPEPIEPHIGILFKILNPKIHLNGHSNLRKIYIWTHGPWFRLFRWYLQIFIIFISNLNGFPGFHQDLDAEVNSSSLFHPESEFICKQIYGLKRLAIIPLFWAIFPEFTLK
jgi:hypothetical protein